MADREDEDLQMALRMSIQESPPEAKRSKAVESAEESPEAGSRRVQRELMAAAAEKRIRAAGNRIAISSPAKSRVEVGTRKAAGSRDEEARVKEEAVVGPQKMEVDKIEKVEKERRDLEFGEELAPEVVDQLFSMVFGSGVSKQILAQWSNQGIRYNFLIFLCSKF